MAHDAPTLAALFRVALLGAGVAWSTDDLYAQRPKDRRGREHRWSDIIVSAARQYAGASQGAPFLVGRFLGYCIREGLLTVEQITRLPAPYTGDEETQMDTDRLCEFSGRVLQVRDKQAVKCFCGAFWCPPVGSFEIPDHFVEDGEAV
jgi:hypothetical protein